MLSQEMKKKEIIKVLENIK